MFLKFYCSEEQNECKLLSWSNNNENAASIALKCFKELEIKEERYRRHEEELNGYAYAVPETPVCVPCRLFFSSLIVAAAEM